MTIEVRNTIYFSPEADPTRRMLRVYEPAPGHIIIDTINADGDSEVVEINFVHWVTRDPIPVDALPDFAANNFYFDNLSRLDGYQGYDAFVMQMDWYSEDGRTRPSYDIGPGFGQGEPYPRYSVWDDSPQVPLVPTVSYTESDLSYAQKQERALAALERWREQKRAWLLEAEQRSDLHPELTRHAGYWLRAGDAAVQLEFQDPDVDPNVVAVMIQEAVKGAADITTADEFAMRLNQFITLFPNGPDRAMLWVTKGEGNGSIGEVARLNLADSHQYSAGTLPSEYNPIDHNWMVANQPGAALLDATTAAVGDTVTASVFDPDQPQAGTITYQWQKLVSDLWVNVASATTASYTIPTGTDAGSQFRCLVAYTDLYGPNQSAVSPIVTTT